MSEWLEQGQLKRNRIWYPLLQAILVFWALGLVVYFEHKEGLFNWQWLEAPASKGFFRDLGMPDPRFAPSERAGGFVAILKNATGPYSFNFSNIPVLDLAVSIIMILMYLALGWLIIDCFEVYFPLFAKGCLALTVGCGIFGIIGELVGMLHLLGRPILVIAWIAMFSLVIFVRSRLRLEWHMPQQMLDGSRLSRAARVNLARDWFRVVHPLPFTPLGQAHFFVASALIALISVVLLLHAIGEPETYWDSLILYMGYARMMFLEGGFPYKVVGQVGIGLGANYPHLYPVLTAQSAALAGYWSDTFAQLLPPVAGIASTLLVFYTALELTRDRLIAVSSALLFRAVPYGLSYTQFASDYAIAILFTSAFLYLSLKYVLDSHVGYRWLMWGIAAAAVHINYLMWILWPVALVVIVVAHIARRPVVESDFEANPDIYDVLDTQRALELKAPRFLSLRYRFSIAELLRRREFYVSFLLALALALPWYVRNIVLTGNPVYAFFYNIFRTSKRVNAEVMKSAEVEWLLNGDGLGRVGTTLTEKLANSWPYFVTSSLHWKLAPVFIAFVVPGFLLSVSWIVLRAYARSRNRLHEEDNYGVGVQLRFAVPCAFLFLMLWFYAYCIADFYLYQIIIVLPLFGVFSCYLFQACQSKAARGALHLLVLLVGFAPGLIMGVMGFKLKNTGVYKGMGQPQMNVTALRMLFMDRDMYYRMEFDGDMEMFGRLSELPEGRVILTHENRHLLLDPTLKIVHLDDWEVQEAYRKPAADRLAILDALSIHYYLYVPNEDKHQVNSLLGMDELIEKGHFIKEYETSSSGSSSPDLVKHTVIPANRNVLYRRATLAAK
ncbi:MAG: ArnT family glycosyltransferase [Candidatus Sumerlaeaceae bacterium]